MALQACNFCLGRVNIRLRENPTRHPWLSRSAISSLLSRLVRVDSTLTTTAVILHRDPISLDHRYGNTREEDLARREPAGTCFLLLVFLATLFHVRAIARM